MYEEHCKACEGEQGESVVKEDDSLDKLEGLLLFPYKKKLALGHTISWFF